MTEKLAELLGRVRDRGLSGTERNAQRRSFAWGSAHIENEHITRDTIMTAEEELRREKEKGSDG